MNAPTRRYNYGYLDEGTKRMVRRALLKAVAIPGYQVPFGSREMPIPYGWGTGGMQITASMITPADRLKVIDQGATPNDHTRARLAKFGQLFFQIVMFFNFCKNLPSFGRFC